MQQVFGKDRKGTLAMVVEAIGQIRDRAEAMPHSDIRLEFSPEEFTDSEPAFVLEVCEAVFETWGRASAEAPLIFNLPATVERRPPNQYADMIEQFSRSFSRRGEILVSAHVHNDQGMAVAASELALLAGADRVEGTLFGHGERTGNVDLVILANNLRARGVEISLDFTDLQHVASTVERLTGMGIYYRQPYSGEYVFTAFSGSHQDAINKGMHRRGEAAEKFGMGWKVPYLHIDPADVGRQYEDLIRINSQSGKGGIAWVLEQEHHITVPRPMQPELGQAVQHVSDQAGRELNSQEIYDAFVAAFLDPPGPLAMEGYWPRPDDENPTWIHGELRLRIDGQTRTLTGQGNGPIDAFVKCLEPIQPGLSICDYHEDTMGSGADAMAMAFLQLAFKDGEKLFGAGCDTNINQAAARAILAACNRHARKGS
jgi:2-isopropylmalate synthase